jgi:Fe-S-cluster containining protein
MSDRFVCREGHAWQLPSGASGPASHCPVCGRVGEKAESAPEWGTASVDLTISGERVRADVRIPAGPVRPRQMLPVLQGLTDFFVDRSVHAVETKGAQVSCKKGCAACCRQPVPITRLETHHLGDLVEGLPEPRRSEVRARFARASQRLQEAGLLEKLRHSEQLSVQEFWLLVLEYFALQIACPFLEDESCSIYSERPLACREYLVTSPAENCARLAEGQVEGVPLAARVSLAAARLSKTESAELLPHVPLILALEWAETHAEEPPRPAPELLREVFARLETRPA